MAALKPRPPFQVLIMTESARLGREGLETGYALKRLIVAGVRVFYSFNDKELTLDSAMDKAVLAFQALTDELERERAQQRAYDKARALARAGYVAGGKCFGYDNVRVTGAHGERGPVQYRINEEQAAVVRRIFELKAIGYGQHAIAKMLNAEGAAAPRSQQGRPRAWVSSSVHAVLFRERYRGEPTWNKTKKRERFGQHRASDRPKDQWLLVSAPHQRIVSEELWQAAHAKLATARSSMNLYRGRGSVSKYLLPVLARCAWCNGGMYVRLRTRSWGRIPFYACTSHFTRGESVCRNFHLAPMDQVDDKVLECIGQILTLDFEDEVVASVRAEFEAEADAAADPRTPLEAELASIDAQLERLTDAIATGGQVRTLVRRLTTLEGRRTVLLDALDTTPASRPSPVVDWRRFERDARRVLAERRQALTQPRNIEDTRQILRELLAAPLRFTPILEEGRRGYRFNSALSLAGISAVTSRSEVWRPRAESNCRPSA